MDSPSVAFSTPRSTPYQDTILSAEERSSIRDADDAALLASFLGAKSDLFLSQTVSLTSLITANKAPFQVKPPSPKKRPNALEQRWQERAKSAFVVDSYGRNSERRAKSACSRGKSPTDSSCNIGNSLYLRGMQMKENVKRKAQEWQQSERKGEKQFFKPQINPYSAHIQPRIYSRVEEALLTWGEHRQHKLAQLKSSRTEEELRPCSFTPLLDRKSLQLSEKSSSAQPRFLDLYHLATKRNQQPARKSDCSFHPRIFVEKRVAETPSEFISRLYTSKTRPGEDPAKHSPPPEDSEPCPPAKKPALRTDRYSQPIHDYLYSLKDKTAEQTKASPALEPVENAASHKVFSRFQRACIGSIFAALDQNREGLVSGALRDTAALTEKQKTLLAPVLKEIRTSGRKWPLETFTERALELIATLTVEDRGYLLTRIKANSKASPAVQAKRKAAHGSPRLLSERTSEVTARQKTAQTKAKLQAERSAKETQECSFKPFLSSLETQRYVARKSVL